MFKDRAFNLSILFSTVWHLFWVSLIGIVVTPNVQPSNIYQEVNFLGPILEKTAFDLMVEEVTPQAETRYARSTLFLEGAQLKPRGPRRKVLKKLILDAGPDRYTFVLGDYVKDTKEIPLYFARELRITYKETADKPSGQFIEGPAGEREIIFKPGPPTVPGSLYGNREEYAVKLKFFISNNGIVRDVEPLVSSGYPQVDLQAIRFLKTWRFCPLSFVEKDKSAWGIVTVRVEAR